MDGDITALLHRLRSGDRQAQDHLFGIVYRELHQMAGRRLRLERPGHTLQPTALVHEAYLRLLSHSSPEWENRAHFYAVAAQIMRRILIDYARQHRAAKRGSGVPAIELEGVAIVANVDLEQLLSVDAALDRLAQTDGRQSRIVEMKFFGGLTEQEIGEVLGISSRTVKREWAVAKAWLHAELAV